ncbi:MAG TPA: ComEC family competence protein, partial [Cyclobacteriaceae bacterium]|nr:ComEC family competence protein [Cyclobacteriaceae bacterium]
MKFSEYPFLRYVLFFILGIMLYPYANFLGMWEITSLTFALFGTYLILSLVDRFQLAFRFKTLFPIMAYALLTSMGLMFTYLKDATNDPSHLMHHQKIEGYLGIVNDLDQKKPNTYANRILVTGVKKEGKYQPSTGEVIIYHTLPEPLLPGEMVWVYGNPSSIAPPKNPNEFDYRTFLRVQQIYHSHFVDDKIQRVGKIDHSPVNNFMLRLRASIQENMDRHIQTPYSNQIAKALLLGQKKHVEKELSEAYVTAGTMHVLAVSGLHVGIVYGFFFLFIKPYRLPGHKRILYLS